MNAKLPAKLDPKNFSAIIDSREQNSLNLAPLTSVVSELDTGDYSVSLRNFLTKTTTIIPAQKFSMRKKQARHGIVDSSFNLLTFDRSQDNDSPHAARTCNPTSRLPSTVAACFRFEGSTTKGLLDGVNL